MQLLRGVTISNGGVLPRIHPELLSKKRGGRVKVDSQMTAPEKTDKEVKSSKRSSKKSRGKPGRKPRVSPVLPLLNKTIHAQSHWWFYDFRNCFSITSFHFFSWHLNLLYFVKKTPIKFASSACRRVQRTTKTEPTAQWRMDQEKDSLFLQQRVCSLDKRYWYDSAQVIYTLINKGIYTAACKSISQEEFLRFV